MKSGICARAFSARTRVVAGISRQAL